MYDHKKRSCGTGQTKSTILKHEFRKKDQDGMGKERGGGGDLEVTACPGFNETCQDFILAAARGRWTPLPKMRALRELTQQRDKVPPRPLADPNDQR